MPSANAPNGSSSNNNNRKSQQTKITYCEGSPSWNPDTYLADAELQARAQAYLSEKNDLRSAINTSFGLRRTDNYVYHAIVSVTLPQVQQAVDLGGAHGLHNWYYGEQPQSKNGVDKTESETKPSSSSSSQSQASEQQQQQSTPQPQPATRPQPSPPSVALPPPPRADIEAYLSIFSPSNSASTALRNFASNAKKGSLRAEIGSWLSSKRYIHPSLESVLKIPRIKSSPTSTSTNINTPSLPANPYLTFLSWACLNLEWAGPCASTEQPHRGRPSSHHVLPILMHHFGCVCPSHEALEILRILADGREILDVGSGNGYWTRMLRDYHAFHHATRPKPKAKSKSKSRSKSKTSTTSEPTPDSKKSEAEPEPEDVLPPRVTPIDSAQSSWRTTWVPDTVISDGASYISTLDGTAAGAADCVLLLVYPIVGGGIAGGREGGFTRSLLDAFRGDTVAVVGTQNHNGYTGFRDATMDEFMAREHPGEWVKVVQVPLPSFPGKDEALFVFQRGARAPSIAPAASSPASPEDGRGGR